MKHVLLVTIGFSPNVGGIETHFDDLVNGLRAREWRISVLTYQPLTSAKSAPYFEKHQSLQIYRAPLLRGLFYKLVHSPVLEFLYLMPGLFLLMPFVLIRDFRSIDVIHSHGLVAGFVSVFWGKIFRKRVITTTHSLYEFPKDGIYRTFAQWIFNTSDMTLCLSEQSVREIVSLGVSKSKVMRFIYWINAAQFYPISNAKNKLKFGRSFIVLFVGRLVAEKGLDILIKSALSWPKGTRLVIAGAGPMEKKISVVAHEHPERIEYVGKISQKDLPTYYSAADVFIIPSINEEGFGRVIIEALLCSTPVIGSRKGAIPEAMDDSVGILINPTADNITKSVEKLFRNKALLSQKSKVARSFALGRYSESNIQKIIDSYSADSSQLQ